MKQLHRPDLFSWSRFDEARNLDFHSTLLVTDHGVVAIDPLPLSPHDRAHIDSLGGVTTVVVTNSDHTRACADFAERWGANIAGPRAEPDALPGGWKPALGDGDRVLPNLEVLELHGSKTPGELALLLDDTTLITGDLVRGHVGGRLNLLPPPKLTDPAAAHASVRRLAALPGIETVIVGDGWHIFRHGAAALRELADSLP